MSYAFNDVIASAIHTGDVTRLTRQNNIDTTYICVYLESRRGRDSESITFIVYYCSRRQFSLTGIYARVIYSKHLPRFAGPIMCLHRYTSECVMVIIVYAKNPIFINAFFSAAVDRRERLNKDNNQRFRGFADV